MYEASQLPETYLVETDRRVIWHDDLARFKQLGQTETCRASNVLRRITQLRAKHPEAKRWFITCGARVGVTRKGFALLATRWDPDKRLAIDSLYSKAQADARRETVGGKNMQGDHQKAHEPEPEEMAEGETIPPDAEQKQEERRAEPPPNSLVPMDFDVGGRHIKVLTDFDAEAFWWTQAQMAEALGLDVRTISEHITQIFATGELEHDDRAIRNYRIPQIQGARVVNTTIAHYSLDVFILVGFRARATQQTIAFREKARQIIKDHIAGRQRTYERLEDPRIGDLIESVASMATSIATLAASVAEMRNQPSSQAFQSSTRPSDFGFNPPPPPVTTKKKGQTSLRPFSAEAKRWLKIRMPVDQISGFVEDRLVAQGWAERDAPRNAHTKGNLLATPAGCESGYVVNYQATRPADGVVFPMALNLTKEGADYCQDMIRAEFLPSSGASPTRDGRQSDFFRGHDDGGERN